MRVCKICGKEFKGFIVIDGVRKELYSRKHCNNCVPFGTYNKQKQKKEKRCYWCKQIKPILEFHKDSNNSDGYNGTCKQCAIVKRKLHYEKNKERLVEEKRQYRKNNPEKMKLASKKYRKNNKEKLNKINLKYINNRKKIDIQFKLVCSLRSRLSAAVKCNRKSGSAVRDLGCSINFLKGYLEAQFKNGMTWENWANDGWHIDHIKPLSSFDLTDRKQLLEACHYSNLQPLWAIENLLKGSKIP